MLPDADTVANANIRDNCQLWTKNIYILCCVKKYKSPTAKRRQS